MVKLKPVGITDWSGQVHTLAIQMITGPPLSCTTSVKRNITIFVFNMPLFLNSHCPINKNNFIEYRVKHKHMHNHTRHVTVSLRMACLLPVIDCLHWADFASTPHMVGSGKTIHPNILI